MATAEMTLEQQRALALAEAELKLRQQSQPKQDTSFGQDIMRGFRDPIDAAAQLLPRFLEVVTSAGGTLPNEVSDWFAKEAKRVDALNKSVEQQYRASGGEDISAGRFIGNIVSPASIVPAARAGQLVSGGLQVGRQAIRGAGFGPATMLGRAATAAGTAATISPEDRLRSAGEAALGSYVGEGLVGGLGKIARGPVAQKGVAELYEEGVRPTAAQAVGGAVKTAEEKLESVPLIGSAITKAHRRGMETFNTATLKKVVDDLNKDIDEVTAGLPRAAGQGFESPMKRIEIGEIQPGTTGFQQVKGAVKEAYGRLVENTSGEMTPELQAGLQGIRDLAGTLRGSYAKQIDDILKNTVESRFKPGQRVDGVTIKEIDSELTNLAENYTKSSIADERRIGQAIQEAQRQMHLMMESQNPRYATALRNADSAYFKLKRIEQATTSSVANELMTPAQLLQSLRGRNRAGFAQGTMPMQEWGRAAQEVLGNKYPDSGTAGRLGLGDLFAAGVGGLPKAAAAYFGAQGLYSPAVQDFFVQQALKQPGPNRQAVVRGLSALRQPASSAGASFATGY